MTITKSEIVEKLYNTADLSQIKCASIVESFFDIIKNELEKGNSVKVSRFGKWDVRQKNQRRGRNPQTGEELIIDGRKIVAFKASASLKNKINGISFEP
jgi:integration host factor subunit alpha